MESRVELNRAHFDAEATSYDTKHEKATQEIARRIESKLDFIGVDWVEDDESDEDDKGKVHANPEKEVRLLDYACGTGSMSRVSLPPHTSRAIAKPAQNYFPKLLHRSPMLTGGRFLRRTPHNASALIFRRRWWRPTILALTIRQVLRFHLLSSNFLS